MNKFSRITLIVLSCLVIFQGMAFAVPGIKITAPANNSTVNPGQTITINIEAVDGFTLQEGLLNVYKFSFGNFNYLPQTFTATIPMDAVGEIPIMVIGKDVGGNVASCEITLKVQQTASIQSIQVEPTSFYFEADRNGNVTKDDCVNLCVKGLYSDGVTRDVTDATFSSSDPLVVSVDGDGKIQAHKVGTATITVSNAGINVDIPIRIAISQELSRSETIPPVTTVSIQPSPNINGWNNSDITITLNASDDSGIEKIFYRWDSETSEEYAPGSTATIIMSKEGVDRLSYGAIDNEANAEDAHSIVLKLDKTPPVTTATITPLPDAQGNIKTLPVTVSFTATDNLSGVAFTTPTKTFTTPGTYQVEYYSQDVAGNMENTKTLTLNIVTQDTTAPKISLQLKPVTIKIGRITLTVPHLYTLVYSATDNGSGVKELKAGLIVPDISKFKTNLIKNGRLHININEKKKSITVEAPNPKDVLALLNKEGLLLIQNNRPLLLQELPRSDEWTIMELDGSLIILAPEIVFEAKAVDNANNAAMEKLEYK